MDQSQVGVLTFLALSEKSASDICKGNCDLDGVKLEYLPLEPSAQCQHCPLLHPHCPIASQKGHAPPWYPMAALVLVLMLVSCENLQSFPFYLERDVTARGVFAPPAGNV